MMGGHMHQGHEWMLTTCRRKDENALDEIITLEGGGGMRLAQKVCMVGKPKGGDGHGLGGGERERERETYGYEHEYGYGQTSTWRDIHMGMGTYGLGI